MFEQFEHRQSREEIIMNIEQQAAQLVEAQRTAIKGMRPEISWVFDGETYVDGIDRLWHKASANSVPVWVHCRADDTISCFDIYEIDDAVKRMPHEASADELQHKLDIIADDLAPMTATGRIITLQTSETAGAMRIHVYRNDETGKPVYVRGWVDGDHRVWTSFAMSLDYWA